ncbi:MAG: sigma-54-dependent Fis family transcriptional regulator [Gammaproteobacteria bacterium]
MSDVFAGRHVEEVAAVVRDPESIVTPIARSWKRCVDNYGLDPANECKPLHIGGAELKERKRQLEDVLAVARLECQNLYEQTAGSGYAVVLTDADGVVLHYICNPGLVDSFQKSGLWQGGIWSEASAGTNAIGTCLVEGQPLIVHRDEHFYNCHTSLTCSAAPVRDPHGKLLAILDQTSLHSRDSKQAQLHTMALVNMSARFIENRYFEQFYGGTMVLRFHSRPEFVGVLTEAMVAINEDGRILAANASAVDQLGYSSRQELANRSLSDILHISPTMLDERATYQPHTVWPVRDVRNGRRYFCMLTVQQRSLSVGSARTNGRIAVRVPPASQPPVLDLKALIGDDAHMAYNVRCVERILDKDVPILLTGETGTGKEAFARAIHMSSARHDENFIALNCAAIPETLIESELFGYRHGAFTGARKQGMRGSILQSHKGTLFRDESGDMPPNLQTRLLRVLEDKEVMPLGSDEPVTVDLHIISASHQDMKELVAQGLLREDLYYRLNGITLSLPALRHRSDLEALIRSVLAAENDTSSEVAVDDAAFRQMLNYPWPGNIRELRNVLRTALALSDDGVIRLADLPKDIACAGDISLMGQASTLPQTDEQAAPQDGRSALESAERDVLMEELERNHWNVTVTAKRLRMSRSTLYRKVKKYGIPVSSLASRGNGWG